MIDGSCGSHRSTAAGPRRRHRPRRRAQGVRLLRRRRTGRLRHRAGRVLLPARAVRLRQDDAAQDDRRVRAADARPGHARGRRRLAGAAVPAQRQHGVPAVRAVPAHDDRRQRGLRPAGEEGRRRRGPPPGDGDARHRQARRVRPPPLDASSRAASSSASPWPGRWSTCRPRCCSTSRSPPSTSSCARRCSSSSSGSSARSGITFIFVTHDQGEALTMSDRIAVMSRGRVEQIGTPDRHLRGTGEHLRRRVHRLGQPAARHASTARPSGAPVAVLDSGERLALPDAGDGPRRRSGHRDAAPGADHRRRRPARRRPQPAGGRQGRHLPGLVAAPHRRGRRRAPSCS